jgi:hypothetical protein
MQPSAPRQMPPAHQLLARHQEAAVGQPVDAPPETGRTLGYDLALAVEVHRDDLFCTPVAELEAVLVPAGGLDVREPTQQDPRLLNRRRVLGHHDN